MNGNQKNEEAEQIMTWRSALSQILAVSVKNIVLLGYGMTLGFPTLLIPVLSGDDKSENFSLDQEGLSWIGSIGLISVPFGCFLSGILTQPIGRKRSMQFINVPFLAAWLLFYFSTEVWQIFVALAITGLAGGLMEAPVLTYVAEISQPHLRGMLSSTSSMAVIAGLMIQFILGTFLKWRTVALCSAMIPIVSFNLLFLIPETPLWLLSKKRHDEAKKSLAWLRGWVAEERIVDEYKEMYKHVQMSRGVGNSEFKASNDQIDTVDGQMNGHVNNMESTQIRKRTRMETLKLFQKRNFIRPFLLVSYVFFLSHFNGISAVNTYAINIFTSLRAPIDKYYATAALGIVEVFGCITCVTSVYYVGKRVLTFISLIGTATCFLIVGSFAHTFHINSLLLSEHSNSTVHYDNIEQYSWIPLTFLIIAAYISQIGIRVLPWILTGEIFPNETRAIASGLAATSSYIFGFLCNKIFLSMVSQFTLPGTFWIFSALSIMGLIILYFILPETEGKSLQDITDHFSGKIKLGNNVYKKPKNVSGMDNQAFDGDKKTDSESKL